MSGTTTIEGYLNIGYIQNIDYFNCDTHKLYFLVVDELLSILISRRGFRTSNSALVVYCRFTVLGLHKIEPTFKK